MVETGHFASLWEKMANKIGLKTEILQTDWRRGANPNLIEERLLQDKENKSSMDNLSSDFQKEFIIEAKDK